jgi:hypothetical protein
MEKFIFSPESLQRLTTAQRDALLRIGTAYSAQIEVWTAFDLPADYVAFSTGTIYGGISGEGNVST